MSVAAELSQLWIDLLACASVEPNDDFFALGGDSVLVMMLLLRIEENFGVVLDAGDVFDAPTLTQLAEKIDAAR